MPHPDYTVVTAKIPKYNNVVVLVRLTYPGQKVLGRAYGPYSVWLEPGDEATGFLDAELDDPSKLLDVKVVAKPC